MLGGLIFAVYHRYYTNFRIQLVVYFVTEIENIKK